MIDPIGPIDPRPMNLPVIAPVPKVRRVQREEPRGQRPGYDGRGRRSDEDERDPAPDAGPPPPELETTASPRQLEPPSARALEAGDDDRPHIDISA